MEVACQTRVSPPSFDNVTVFVLGNPACGGKAASTDPGLTPAQQLEHDRYLAFRVFAHPAPLTIVAMFVVSAALERTGVIEWLGDRFEQLAASSEGKMLLILMVLVALVFLVNAMLGPAMLPAAEDLANKIAAHLEGRYLAAAESPS